MSKWRMLWLLPFIILSSYNGADAAKKRVCIIGAGAAGLVSLKQAAMHPDQLEPVVFERRSEEGGLWLYSEGNSDDEFGLPIRTGIYKYLRTNGPKELLAYPDYVEFHGENRSYLTHMDMLRYIQNYTDQFDLRKHIQFNHFVEKVTAVSDVPNTQWIVKTRNLKTNEYADTLCDSVMVCNGHYSKHYIPELPGLETFPGLILHSLFYREPQMFKGKTVVVMGSGSSGTDIGLQISWFAKKIYLSHRSFLGVELPENMEEVPAVVSVNGNELTLSDGQVIVADAFVLCTGYEYDFPFLGKDSGIEIVEGKYVRSLYKHFVNIEHPTMAIIGIQFPSIPFTVAYIQARYFISVLTGETILPSYDEMMKNAQLPPDVPVAKAHFVSEGTIDYYDDLARVLNADTLGDKLFARVFWHFIADKKIDLMNFKDKDVIVFEDGSFELRRQYYPIFGIDHEADALRIY